MGLDAYVLCNCYKERRIKQPPVVFDKILFEENDYYLDMPYKGNEDLHDKFDEWKKTACDHPDFRIADEWISNWFQCSRFKRALERIGSDYFPTLISEWPKANGGEMSSEKARIALKELDTLYSTVSKIEGTFLVDYESGNELYGSIEGNVDEFAWLGKEKMIYGLCEEGFFVLDSDRKHKFFSSKNFTQKARKKLMPLIVKRFQRPKGKDVQTEYEVIFTDLASEERFKCNHPITDYNKSIPRRLHIVKRKLNQCDFKQITQALTNVFKASVDTGNPVAWS